MGIEDIIKEAQAEGILWSLAVKTEVMKSFLGAVGRSKFAEDLVLQGGGAMKFVYGSPRYSVDLDFVLRTPRQNWLHFMEVGKVLPDLFGHPITSSPKKVGEKMLRIAMVLQLGNREALSTKVEICAVPSQSSHLEESQVGKVLVESPEEIVLDKLAANIDRLRRKNFIKTHDVFDFFYVLKSLGRVPSWKQDDVEKKLQAYGTSCDSASVQSLLVWFEQERHFEEFRKTLDGYLPQKTLQKMDLRMAFKTVKEFIHTVFAQ